LFCANYGAVWLDTVNDERAELIKQCLWRDVIGVFNVDVIKQAAKEVLVKCPIYPPKVGEFYSVCQEIVERDNKPKIPWATDLLLEQREIKKTEMPDSLRKLFKNWHK